VELPAIIVSLLLASIYALAYALVMGKTGHRLWLYWAFSVAGFFGGFVIAAYHHWTSLGLGEVPVVESSVTAVALLVVASVLRL